MNYQIEGVEADGNCFFNAFLKSYNTLSRKIPLLDIEVNKISYLRSAVAKSYQDESGKKIMKDREPVSSREVVKLAKFLHVPIRVVTANENQTKFR